MHMLDPSRYQLSIKEDAYLQVLSEAYGIICEGRPTRESRKIIRERLEGKTSYRVTAVVQDCQSLFGRFEEINQRVQAGIYRDKLQILAQKAEDENSIEGIQEARRCYEALIQLDQCDKIPVEEDEIDTKLPAIQFTDTLTLAIGEQSEDAELDYDTPN